jgi:hypothetical protein
VAAPETAVAQTKGFNRSALPGLDDRSQSFLYKVAETEPLFRGKCFRLVEQGIGNLDSRFHGFILPYDGYGSMGHRCKTVDRQAADHSFQRFLPMCSVTAT